VVLVLAGIALAAPATAQRLPDTVEWSVPSTAPPAGAPVVARGSVVVPLSTGVIAAHALDSGALLWSTEIRAQQSLATDDERVYVAEGEAIHALNAANGRVVWRVPLSATPTAPALARGGWVVAAAGGDLIAIRAEDGTVMWRKPVGPVEFRPSLDGDLLVVSIVDGQVAALNIQDGTTRWTMRLGASPSEPFAIGGLVYVGTKDRYFYFLRSSSGRIEERRRVAAELLGRVAVTDRHVYFTALDNTVNAVRRRGGALDWHQGVLYRPGAGPVVLGDVVVVPGYVDSPLPAFSNATGAAAGAVSFGGLLVALPVFTKLPDGRDAVVGITGGLENKWMVTLRAQSFVPPIAVQPLTVLPGVAVTILPPGL
jgi:outer membrane protein assembly factor BamB